MERDSIFLGKASVTLEEAVSWAVHHTVQNRARTEEAISAMLPLFVDKSDSPAMVIHAMEVLITVTQYLNPRQVSVMWRINHCMR